MVKMVNLMLFFWQNKLKKLSVVDLGLEPTSMESQWSSP